MKLNHDCVRALLLTLEDFQEITNGREINELPLEKVLSLLQMSEFTKDDVIYSTRKLHEAGFLRAHIIEADDVILGVSYSGLTYAGHEYLDAIRSKEVWSKVRASIIKNGGSLAFTVIQQLAVKILLQLS